MYYSPIDYTAEEVQEIWLYFEQLHKYEKKQPTYQKSAEMTGKALHILRGVAATKEGTKFITERGTKVE